MNKMVLARPLDWLLISFLYFNSLLYAYSSSVSTSYGVTGNNPVAPYLIGSWSLDLSNPSSICQVNTCCCFSNINPINIYTMYSGELYINGSVTGFNCDSITKSDNLDPPTSFIFHSEFFGIDDFYFNLSNSSLTNSYKWSLSALSSSRKDCSFALSQEKSLPLPPSPPVSPTNPPPDPGSLPDYIQPYIGSWSFNNDTNNGIRCASELKSCCCFLGEVQIYADPNGVSSFFAKGNPSIGCDVNGLEIDDFPWPSSGSSKGSSISVPSFLHNNDRYSVGLRLTDSSYTLAFINLNNPQCSMYAVRSINLNNSNNLNSAAVALAVLLPILVIIILIMAYFLFKRANHFSKRTSLTTALAGNTSYTNV